ncbi:uncharacterized protein PODANS_1_8170 [Podospora anserina S mat+]|uniref:Podospora anserina S mat+ genomic DNA chromosome 1, supercontig 1 n=1 Tax=Podospora anserina (strain S / ATCC MYA-4624 / DSM 980 / FGSC 10383) TaxID=515849 RepID=B2A921_PODAN|nr:uncharacterized protein PODANS_1_8170 [Podospora anserina S mat+]CAP60522.1 unnamed protein product [Podospora anserina S mat+]CDP23165.1 Putative protein of unknown function [Podospora anserina S mat+]
MLASPRLVHLLKFAGPALIVVWLVAYMVSDQPAYNSVVRQFKSERDIFITDFLDHDVGGQLDGSSISELCASKTWTPGLMLSCDPQSGGFGQVKDAHLNCIRFAIEAGAELVLPRIIKRDDKNVANTRPKNGGGPYIGEFIDYLFDYEYLNQTLSEHCPQLKLYRSMNELWDVPQVQSARKISLQDVGAKLNGSVIEDMNTLSEQIKSYIDRTEDPETRPFPIRFRSDVISSVFPTAYGNPELAKNFGRLLRPRKDARVLAAIALYNLHKKYQLNLDPKQGFQHSTFPGLHLRTEADATPIFPPFDDQVSTLVELVTNSTTGFAFVATGETEERRRKLSKKAEAVGVTMVYKQDLMLDEPEGRELLEQLTWDQRALVDYEIMLRAGLTVGLSGSIFDWNIALRRNSVPGADGEPQSLATSSPIQHQDRYSILLGSSEKADTLRATVWP